ncbi:MAG: cell division protein FtsA [Patescibacteria group bacterium]
MKFFSNISSPKKDELVLVFDIGSSSVGGALFYTNPGGAPKIILSLRESITLEPSIDFDRFLFLTSKSLEAVADRIAKSGLGAPKKIFCILSSPWYVSQTRVISLEKETPFIFTEKLAQSLIDKEIALFEQDYLAKYAHPKDAVRTIEIKTIRTTLNGYESIKPFNQKAKEFEMTLFISISPEQVLSRMEQSINKYFHNKDIKFSTFVMASFVVARDVFAHEDNFLLIDLGGEVTDLAMVKKTILRESISYPTGCNFIIRGIAEGLNCPLEEAKSYLSLYKDGHAVGAVEARLTPVVTELKKTWLNKFQESLANLSNDISIPSKIFLVIDKEYFDFFSEIIKTEQFNQYTLTDSKFEVVFLGTEALSGLTLFELETVRDQFMIIGAIYINHFFH